MSIGTDCFGVAFAVAFGVGVAFDFVFDFNAVPLLTLPIVQDRKWIKKVALFEPKASFDTFPFFVLLNWEPEGQWQRGRLSLLTFFGEAKKVSGCRATPDLLNNEQQARSNQNQNKNVSKWKCTPTSNRT